MKVVFVSSDGPCTKFLQQQSAVSRMGYVGRKDFNEQETQQFLTFLLPKQLAARTADEDVKTAVLEVTGGRALLLRNLAVAIMDGQVNGKFLLVLGECAAKCFSHLVICFLSLPLQSSLQAQEH